MVLSGLKNCLPRRNNSVEKGFICHSHYNQGSEKLAGVLAVLEGTCKSWGQFNQKHRWVKEYGSFFKSPECFSLGGKNNKVVLDLAAVVTLE